MINPATIEKVKEAVDLLDLVGDFVKLKKSGSNYMGLCPFHFEKSPSFVVSPAKDFYKCFGCGKKGNGITFLMEHEKLSYLEAIRWLAKRYQIEIEEVEVTVEEKENINVAASLKIINQFCTEYFEETLYHTEEGKDIALSYLQERKFSENILKKFRIGFGGNGRDLLAKRLLKQQFNPEYLLKTGLVRKAESGNWYDSYQGRIVFPIHDIYSGAIIGFGARVIGKPQNAPKYINTPENELYKKSKILYGFYFARRAVIQEDECFLVEGYTDVVSLHDARVENVVASGGTSLTADQLRLIKKHTNKLTIIYDGDKAGIQAALRGIDLALEEGLEVKVVLIPDGEDPDSFVRLHGREHFQDFIQKNKKDFIIYQTEILLKEAGSDINEKNKIANTIALTLSKINRQEDFVKRQEYIKQCAFLLKIDEYGLIDLVNKKMGEVLKRQQLKKFEPENNPQDLNFSLQALLDDGITESIPPTESAQDPLESSYNPQEAAIIKWLMEKGEEKFEGERTCAEHILGETEIYEFESPVLGRIYEKFKAKFNNKEPVKAETFVYDEDESIRNAMIDILSQPYELSKNWENIDESKTTFIKEDLAEELNNIIVHFKLRKIYMWINETVQKISSEQDPQNQLQLLKVLNDLKNIEGSLGASIGNVIYR